MWGALQEKPQGAWGDKQPVALQRYSLRGEWGSKGQRRRVASRSNRGLAGRLGDGSQRLGGGWRGPGAGVRPSAGNVQRHPQGGVGWLERGDQRTASGGRLAWRNGWPWLVAGGIGYPMPYRTSDRSWVGMMNREKDCGGERHGRHRATGSAEPEEIAYPQGFLASWLLGFSR